MIEIKDADLLLEQAGDLAQMANNISSTSTDLSAANKKIAGAWASDTVDKDSYLKTLNDNITKIQTLVTAISGLSKVLTIYAERHKQNEQV